MSLVSRSHTVSAAIAPTWAAIASMRAVEDWHPNVARSRVLTDYEQGVGASRRVEFQDGNSVVETVIEQSDMQFTTMELSELPMLDRAVVTIRTKAQTAGATEVTFSIDYKLKFGPLGWLFDRLVMRRAFRKVFSISLKGLSYHLETGKLVKDSIP